MGNSMKVGIDKQDVGSLETAGPSLETAKTLIFALIWC
jgi:hypothetical protein